jgi:hypothetical protein
MYVVRLKVTDGEVDFKAFTKRPSAFARYKAGEANVRSGLDHSALFEVASTDDPRTAIEMVKSGKANLLELYPRPMTQAEASEILRSIGLE